MIRRGGTVGIIYARFHFFSFSFFVLLLVVGSVDFVAAGWFKSVEVVDGLLVRCFANGLIAVVIVRCSALLLFLQMSFSCLESIDNVSLFNEIAVKLYALPAL